MDDHEIDATCPTHPSPQHSYIWIAAIWTAFGLVDGIQTVLIMRGEGMHHAWIRLLAITTISWLPWALATPLVIRLARRFPPVTLRPLAKWPLHLAAAIAIGLAFSAFTAALSLLLHPYADISAPASAELAHPPRRLLLPLARQVS